VWAPGRVLLLGCRGLLGPAADRTTPRTHPPPPAPLSTHTTPTSTHTRRSILTDELLRAKGSDGSIYVLGDASTIDQPKALNLADELFEK
jgi:hypothetical protein